MRDTSFDAGDLYLMSWSLAWDFHQTFHDSLRLFDSNNFFPYRYTLALSEHQWGIELLFFPAFAAGLRPLTVHGWARVPGRDLGVTVLIDRAPRVPLREARLPRPGVQAALPSLGDCSTAGYEHAFAFQPGDEGEHELSVIFRGPNDRVRHYPWRKSTWKKGP